MAQVERVVLGGGCFWCLEAVLERLPGVLGVTSGYAGGHAEHPTYEQVCTGATGHAEVVQVEFDPSAVALDELLDLFWDAHDPTTPNRQGADAGTQYRSVILWDGPDQRDAAQASCARAQARFAQPIVTQIAPLQRFWPAEASHKSYFRRNPTAAYCRVVILPKLAKLEHRAPR